MNEHAKAGPFLAAVVAASKRIVSMDGREVAASSQDTDYVLPGRLIQLESSLASFRFWAGVNGPRLFFSTNLERQSPYRAGQNFKTYFDSACRLGWTVHFDVLGPTTLSLWADCLADADGPLSELKAEGTHVLTDAGAFWANEIAMMAQACLRTCERHAIRCSERAPMLP